MTRGSLAAVRKVICAMAGGLVLAGCAHVGITSDPPHAQAQSVNSLMNAHPGDDFHIVLIHGIGTSDRTTWDGFRQRLCQHLAGWCASSSPQGPISEQLILSPHAPAANFLGTSIWPTDAEWDGSQPFVDHYIFKLKSGRHLIVDEINWWPLALAFKCQFIVPDETALVGPNKGNINICAMHGDGIHFPWFSEGTANSLLAIHPMSGGAPWVNASLKADVLDWGISDAVLSLGTLKGLLRETVRCSFADIAGFNWDQFGGTTGTQTAVPLTYVCGHDSPTSPGQPPSKARFVIISHSLGAFLLMDTFATAAADARFYRQGGADNCRPNTKATLSDLQTTGGTAAEAAIRSRNSQSFCLILTNSNYLYFFANQFALLELARAQGLSDFASKTTTGPVACGDALSLWAGCGIHPTGEKQIVAFSDPGDILTFKVPKITGANVINFYTHNAPVWFGAVESPLPAHMNYMTNDDVLKIVFGN